MKLAEKEVLKRLCKMCAQVRESISKSTSRASDCFCGQSAPDPLRIFFQPSDFQFDSQVLKFIEDAVAQQIKMDGIARRYYS